MTPYGSFWVNAVWESARTNAGDYVFYVLSPDAEGEPSFHLDVKSSRFGLNGSGPDVCLGACLASKFKLEVDFQGAFVTENKASVLLRHAYWELRGPRFSVLAGQTWDVISPLNPGMLMYTVGWGGGNIGYRRAQFRGELTAGPEARRLTVQASLNSDIVTDFAGSATAQCDHSDWPVAEARAAVGLGRPKALRAAVGVSGHYGQQRFDWEPFNPGFDKSIETWSVNIDAQVQVPGVLSLSGEWFTGKNLGAYLGGILQGVTCESTRKALPSTGGWIDLGFRPMAGVQSHLGFGIDDPDETDLVKPTARTYNRFVFANVTRNVSDQLVAGVEVSHWRTEFVGQSTGQSLHVNFMTKYSF